MAIEKGQYKRIVNKASPQECKEANKRRAERRNQRCPNCGITYRKFRMSVSMEDVLEMLKAEVNDKNHRRTHITRYTWLGKCHEFKELEWNEHLEMCKENSNE